MYVHNCMCCTKPSGILFLPTIIPTYIVVLSFAGGGVVGWMSGLVMGEFMFWGWGEDYDYTSGVIQQLAGCDLRT